MSYDEVLDWSEYIRARGSLNPAVHLERGFALLAMIITSSLGGKKTMKDFMPHAPEETDQELSLEEAMEKWQ